MNLTLTKSTTSSIKTLAAAEDAQKEQKRALKTDWLEQVPKVLCLQMNRLEFINNE